MTFDAKRIELEVEVPGDARGGLGRDRDRPRHQRLDAPRRGRGARGRQLPLRHGRRHALDRARYRLGAWHSALLRIDDPAPGVAHALVYGDAGWATVQACVYGDAAAAVAARVEPVWREWMESRFSTTSA